MIVVGAGRVRVSESLQRELFMDRHEMTVFLYQV